MAGRGSRGKPRTPKRTGSPEETTTRFEISPELLESLLDDGDRPTARLPAEPSFFPSGDEHAPRKEPEDATVRKRVVVGFDGIPEMLDADDLDEATHPHVPSKTILVAEMLVAMAAMLEEMGESSRTRELRAKTRRYERVVKGWGAVLPSDAQRDATFDLVTELHRKVVEARRIHRLSVKLPKAE